MSECVKDRLIRCVWTVGAAKRIKEAVTGEIVEERLLVTPEAADLTRFNAGAPVLAAHGTALDNILGVVERAWIADGAGHAILRFSTRDSIGPIWCDIQHGILRWVSVGYVVDAYTETAPGARLATSWAAYEISIVAMPSDPACCLMPGAPLS